MRVWLTAAALAALPTAALADPTLQSVTSATAKARRLDVTVQSTFAAPGELTLTGTVNGRAVSLRKRMKAGSKATVLKVDAKRFGARRLETDLVFDLTVTATETGGASASQDLDATVALPVIVLPGLGNEDLDPLASGFPAALNAAAGGVYTLAGDRPTLVVHGYPSLSKPLATLGRGLSARVKSTLRKGVFAKVDLVCYSYGGLVARSFLAQDGGSRVRTCAFLATPNEGTAVAYLGVGLLENGQLDALLAGNPDAAALVEAFVNEETKDALRNLFPTYSWYTPRNLLTDTLVANFLGDPSTPLTALNQSAPPPGVALHAFFYTSTGTEMGTVDVVNVADLSATPPDLAALASGAGDGLVAARSVRMDDVPAWASVIADHDLGAGTHAAITSDPATAAAVASVLAR